MLSDPPGRMPLRCSHLVRLSLLSRLPAILLRGNLRDRCVLSRFGFPRPPFVLPGGSNPRFLTKSSEKRESHMAAETVLPAWGILSQLVFLLLLGGVPMGGLPPLPEDKALVGAAPRECLLYMSWYGAGETAADSKNQAERLMADPDVRRCFSTLWKELQAAVRRDGLGMGPQNAAMLSETALPLVEIFLTRPCSLFISDVELRLDKARRPDGVNVRAGILVNAGPHKESLQRILARLERMALPELDEAAPKTKEVTIAGVKLRQLPLPAEAPKVFWGFQGDYLVVAVGDGTAETMLAALKTPAGPPKWLKQVHERLPVERPTAVSYLNLKQLRDTIVKTLGEEAGTLKRLLETTGLDTVESLASVSGLDQTDSLTKTFLATEGPPRGVLNLVADKPLTAADLSAVPRDATFAAVARFDAVKAYQMVWDMIREYDPRAVDRAKAELSAFEEQIGFRIREDLLEGLGDVYSLYSSSGEGGMLLGITAAIQVRDRDKLDKVSDALRDMIRRGDGRDGGPSMSSFRQRGQLVHVLDLGRGIPVAPAWCVTDGKLLIALYPQSIKSYLARPAEAGTLADVPEVAAALKDKPSSLTYENTPELFRTFYPYLQMVAPMVTHELKQVGMNVDASLLPAGSAIYPYLRPSVSMASRRENGILSTSRRTVPGAGVAALVPVAAALALPAYRVAGEASDVVVSSNNLKQMALAMHIYHDTHDALPAPANYDKDGKPLLSWRVHILPYIERTDLYEQFKLDEPWDSEHNKKLIKHMPAIYKVPSSRPIAVGVPAGKSKEEARELMEFERFKTSYLVPAGERTMFPKGKAGSRGTRLAQIVDGLSNTIMIVEAAPDKALIWTKPDDWQFNPDKPTEGLFGYRPNGFLAALGDGSVRTVSRTLPAGTIKAMFTRDGREVVDFDAGIRSPVPRAGNKVPQGGARATPPKRIEPPRSAPPRKEAVPKDVPKD
jgi:hypothetical protein